MSHIPVLLREINQLFPANEQGIYLDVTFGGGGHFFSLLKTHPNWQGEAWDQDPLAASRFNESSKKFGEQKYGHINGPAARVRFVAKNFSDSANSSYDFILADLGVSSFQLDDLARGMSFRSEAPVDFRMNTDEGINFRDWLKNTSEFELASILEDYGEEPKAKKLARAIKKWPPATFDNAKTFADRIATELNYGQSRVHAATRTFQALRIAINGELDALKSFLTWAPKALNPGGRLAIISFHSLEDRWVKNVFRDLAKDDAYTLVTKKPVAADDSETEANPRARSAKLRVLQRN